jgi:hypothetical protein
MIGRLGGLLRDCWYLMLIVLAASVLFGVVIHWFLALVVPVIFVPVFIYFAIIRYDDDGRPRASG